MASKVQLQYEIALVMGSQTKDMAGESVCYEDRPNQWELFYIIKESAERVRRVNIFIDYVSLVACMKANLWKDKMPKQDDTKVTIYPVL